MVWKIEDKNISAEHFYRVGGILVKAFRTGHYFLALFFTGFLTGILIVNYIWGEQLSLIGTFTEVYLMRLKNEKISFQQYIWYLIQVRGIFFLVLFWRWESGLEKLWQRFFFCGRGCQEEFYCQRQ